MPALPSRLINSGGGCRPEMAGGPIAIEAGSGLAPRLRHVEPRNCHVAPGIDIDEPPPTRQDPSYVGHDTAQEKPHGRAHSGDVCHANHSQQHISKSSKDQLVDVYVRP